MSDVRRLDLHVHSRHSPDSRLTLEAIAGRLPFVELHGFALTDHNSVRGHRELAELSARLPRYLLVPGVEVSTAAGHLLAYGISEAPPAGRPIEETLDWIRGRGGVAVLAHPFRWSHGVGRRVAETAGVPALETCNGHNSELANLRAESVAAQRQLGMTGGSDAHQSADVGRAFTEFDSGVGSVEDVLAALRRGAVTGAGRSLPWSGRLRLGVRTGLLRAARGFRPI